MTSDEQHNVSLSLLVIDDDAADRKLISRTLKKSDVNCQITEACNVEEALKKVSEGAFDCILLDYRMPESNGIEGTKRIKEVSDVPIIMLTGHGDETIATEALKAGVVDYLPKDKLNHHKLQETIDKTIERAQMGKKLQQQREELEMFSHVLVHDLRAPFATIQQIVETMKQMLERGQYDELPKMIDYLESTSAHGDELITTLHAYTQLDSDTKYESVSSQKVIDTVLTNLNSFIKEKNGVVKVSPDLPRIVANKAQLVELLQNLVANGLKYNRSPAPEVKISVVEKDNAWLFEVKDNGIGINEKDLKTIFAPFKRLHGNKEFPGIGLGLTTCTKIAKRHEGKLWAESDGKSGTQFYFTIAKALTPAEKP